MSLIKEETVVISTPYWDKGAMAVGDYVTFNFKGEQVVGIIMNISTSYRICRVMIAGPSFPLNTTLKELYPECNPDLAVIHRAKDVLTDDK